MLPPSPAPSECDSLDGIDDLDAFLASQGQLSQWPTPPSLQKDALVETTEIDADAETESESDDFRHIATTLSEAGSIDIQATPLDVEIIRNMLLRADLPMEVIALALNILSGLHTQESKATSFTDTPPDLIVVGAFSLAVSYTNDHAPRPFWWSHFICDCHWTAKRIGRTVWRMLEALDFGLHQFTREECMENAMSRLSEPAEPEPTLTEMPPLKLQIDSNITRWEYGQLTPDATPPCSASPAVHLEDEAPPLGWRMPLMRFLPLL
ncbi:hypothetical protein M409DRAFT_28482 [Zasmidium cellare ATCC 36951]|uniref:Cyclin N-terminal domain-containing protein n=1 Tax=Zasmidium cellare ATCC 36951 TaxID=1080233 RepID=A0A6A6C246_ZASCE|nr:uncharacterized protein M409DRAFT_28482 [Zasmidium cellare ATCC 36951]KAF2161154.1 hypothetical protein M409DRAFT_28482 [Zasmidium cellare ATCC 36951]